MPKLTGRTTQRKLYTREKATGGQQEPDGFCGVSTGHAGPVQHEDVIVYSGLLAHTHRGRAGNVEQATLFGGRDT